MQIKTTLRFYFKSFRMMKTNYASDCSYWQRCGAKEQSSISGGNVKSYSKYWNQYGRPSENLESIYLKTWLYHSSVYAQITLGHTSLTTRPLFKYYHFSLIHNIQKLKTNLISLNQQIDKENVIYFHLYSGELLSWYKIDIMKFVGKYKQLENIFLGEITKTPNLKYGIYSLIHGH